MDYSDSVTIQTSEQELAEFPETKAETNTHPMPKGPAKVKPIDISFQIEEEKDFLPDYLDLDYPEDWKKYSITDTSPEPIYEDYISDLESGEITDSDSEKEDILLHKPKELILREYFPSKTDKGHTKERKEILPKKDTRSIHIEEFPALNIQNQRKYPPKEVALFEKQKEFLQTFNLHAVESTERPIIYSTPIEQKLASERHIPNLMDLKPKVTQEFLQIVKKHQLTPWNKIVSQ